MRHLFIVLIFLSVQGLNAQRHDNVWMTGYNARREPSNFIIRFDKDTLQWEIATWEKASSWSNYVISDEDGDLLFYTSGLALYTKDFRKMHNGDSINFGHIWESYNRDDTGYPSATGYVILPSPGNALEYNVLYKRLTFSRGSLRSQLYNDRMWYSKVSFVNSTYGLVTEKNTLIIEDTLGTEKLQACKHANGRDWWLLTPRYDKNEFYRILVSPKGVEVAGEQTIGRPTYNGLGQAVFSPDGSKYVVWNAVNPTLGLFLDIYDFDRCTGLLSNPQQLNFIDTRVGSGGVAISPNSRFLYHFTTYQLIQYDLWEEDVFASADTIDVFDGFRDPFFVSFYLLQLAPDGKIYGSTPGSSYYLHVIHRPDEKGKDCRFEQRGVKFPHFISDGLGNFPNYRLGALPGSPCDTIRPVSVQDNVPVHGRGTLHLYPNPANAEVTVKISRTELSIENIQLIDVSGNLAGMWKFEGAGTVRLNVSGISSGFYFMRILTSDNKFEIHKIVLQR